MSPGLDETQQLRSSISLSIHAVSEATNKLFTSFENNSLQFQAFKIQLPVEANKMQKIERFQCWVFRTFSAGSFGLSVQSLSHIFFPVYYIIQYTMHLRQDNCDMIVPTHCVDQIERYVNFEHIVLLNPKILCFLRLFCIFVKIIGILQCISCSFAKTIWWKK